MSKNTKKGGAVESQEPWRSRLAPPKKKGHFLVIFFV